jgi:hypothetical protein
VQAYIAGVPGEGERSKIAACRILALTKKEAFLAILALICRWLTLWARQLRQAR